MIKKYPKVLIGEICYLTPVSSEFIDKYYLWINDPKVTNTLIINPPMILEQEEKWFELLISRKNTYLFNIMTNDNKIIGNTGMHNINSVDRNADFGIMIGEKDYWGKGYGTEVTKLMLIYGFYHLNLHSIYLNVYSYNKKGIRAYEKAGYKQDGVIRQNKFYKGVYKDTILMSVIRDEWEVPDTLSKLNLLDR